MTRDLIEVESLAKKFCRDFRRSLYYGLGDLLSGAVGANATRDALRKGEFWAIRDVNFSLKRGECLGLIGRNGAGKTTLLRTLNGLIRPDIGTVRMRGSVGALIALGAGIKDVLTGRENIYCMGALRGMSRSEVAHKMDEIIEFAELSEAIDAPIQSYSSGMRVRLNFAVATALEPDILFLDEVLAVGDAAFREKCYHRIATIRRKAAVIFVSHNMEQVARISDRAIVMDRGSPQFIGDTGEAISIYERLNDAPPDNVLEGSFLSLHDPVLAFTAKPIQSAISTNKPLELELELECGRDLVGARFKVILYSQNGAFAADGITNPFQDGIKLPKGKCRIRINIASMPLRNGRYALSIHASDHSGDIVVWSHKNNLVTVRDAYAGSVSDLNLQVFATAEQIQSS